MFSVWAAVPSLILFAVHVAVCVTLVTATGALALWLARRRSAPLRHTLALTGLAVTFLVPAVVAMYHWRLIPQRALETTHSIAAPQVPQAVLPAGPAPLEETASPASPRPRSYLAFYLLSLFVAVWTVGSGVKLARLLFALARQRMLLAALTDVKDGDVSALAEQLRHRFGIRRQVRLMSFPHAPWPFTVGFLRPRLVLPEALLSSGVPERQLESVLTHELAHIARFDYAAVLLSTIAEAAYWWNPFVHFTKRELAVAREEVCDNYALNHTGDGEPLATYLLQTVEQAATARLAWGVGMSAEEPGVVACRIKHLLMGEKNSMIRISSLAVGLVILAAFVVSFFFTHVNYANADLIAGTPVNLGPVVNSPAWADGDPEISADGLKLYFSMSRDAGPRRIAVSQRNSPIAPWSAPTIVPELNGTSTNPWFRTSPTVTDDQLLMFFYASPTGTTTNWDIYQSSRASVSASWEEPVSVGAPINSPSNDQIPGISADGLTLYFASNRHGPNGNNNGEDLDIYMAQRTSRSESFSAPIRLGNEINSGNNEGGPDVSSDGLLLMFHSTRDAPEAHIFYSERASTSDPWAPAKKLAIGDASLVSRGNPSLSADKAHLYFTGRIGDGDVNTADLYVVDIVPEPSATALIVAGCVLSAPYVLLVRRRRRDTSRHPTPPARANSR